MYTKSITRDSRSLLVIAIDQSGSMAGKVKVGGRVISKAELLCDATNDIIAELIERSRRSEGVRDYYDVAIIGYSGNSVKPLIGESRWVSIADLDRLYTDERDIEREYLNERGELGLFKSHERRWVTPTAAGKTPMYEALTEIYDTVELWLSDPRNQDSFPPIIFNITDGESTDCDYNDIIEISSKIKALSTYDGNSILFNIHIASTVADRSLIFPSLEEITKGGYNSQTALSLFYASSELPPPFIRSMREVKETNRVETFKAMSFNCSASELFAIINIGSITIKCY